MVSGVQLCSYCISVATPFEVGGMSHHELSISPKAGTYWDWALSQCSRLKFLVALSIWERIAHIAPLNVQLHTTVLLLVLLTLMSFTK